MNIALIAHDRKKKAIVDLTIAYKELLQKHQLYATGTTGQQIMNATSLEVHCFNSGPLGGDQQIGALISENKIDMIVFLRDPLASQPHEPDVNALIRLSDVYDVPLATNEGTAEVLIRGLAAGYLDFRKVAPKELDPLIPTY